MDALGALILQLADVCEVGHTALLGISRHDKIYVFSYKRELPHDSYVRANNDDVDELAAVQQDIKV